MNISKGFVVVFFLLVSNPCFSSDLSATYQMTRSEWLGVVIKDSIETKINMWKSHVVPVVTISDKDDQIVVGLTLKNGEEELSQAEKARYVNDVKELVLYILSQYEWAKELKLTVQFIL